MGCVGSASQETCHPSIGRAVRDATAAMIGWTSPTRGWGRAHPIVLARRRLAPCGGIFVSDLSRPLLIICTTCRTGPTSAEYEPIPGARLHIELERLLAYSEGSAPVVLLQAACLANCERGCSGAISMPGKWTYLLGFLSAKDAADLLTYGAVYASSTNGTVLPSQWPASLRYAIVGRVPPIELLA